MTNATKNFRKVFNISKERINWYPGHMKFSLSHMQAKMRSVDFVIEVHDARIPLSGRNPAFLKNLIGSKPHFLVLSKADLIDKSNFYDIQEKLEMDLKNEVILVNSLDQNCEGLKSVIPRAVSILEKIPINYTKDITNYKMMVVGVPNVGKSTLINSLRNTILHKGKATAVGAIPGVTRKVQNEIKVSLDPPINLIDTPGILSPNISNVECGMKLALCSCLKVELVGAVSLADFLLYWMNKTQNFIYLNTFGVREPIDEIMPLLIKIAIDNNKMMKIKNISNNTIERVPNIEFAAHHMISLFKKGNFGDLNLDKDIS